MTEADWQQLIRLLAGLGLTVVSVDRTSGQVVVQVRL